MKCPCCGKELTYWEDVIEENTDYYICSLCGCFTEYEDEDEDDCYEDEDDY